jgi:hypothetical protein
MSYFDEDTSIMQFRLAQTPIDLRLPQLAPQTKARGVLNGVMLGALIWAAIIALGFAVHAWWLGH